MTSSDEHIRALVRDEIRKFRDDFLPPVLGKLIGRSRSETEDALTAKFAGRQINYRGAWTEGASYRRGDLVLLGSLWHAGCDTTVRPGANGDWEMFLPKARDGRDGRDAPNAPPEPPAQRTTRSHR